VLLMFLIAPGMEAPLVAHLNQPVKPIKTWVGNSSWYGPGFNGRKTANGERFDSEALTAAHPNLPFGSLVRVVNPRNGKFELVRRRRALSGVQHAPWRALAGKAMLDAASQSISAGVPIGAGRPRLLAVTILTSMDQKAMKEAGIGGAPKLRVVKLAQLAKSAGVDGVVASVQEAKAIRKACGTDFLIATPGVRPKNSPVESKSEDQARK